MVDREKVIKGLECCSKGAVTPYIPTIRECADCPYSQPEIPCTRLLAKEALALLKAQEPMEPVLDIDTWKCGNCGHTLEHQQLLGDNVLFHEQYNYCPECGRAVKWNA